MKKQEFCKKYNFASGVVIDPKCKLFFASSISDSLVEFLNDRFRGAIDVSSNVNTNRQILVSPEFMAMFFKRLLSDIYGRIYLRMLIESDQSCLTMKISYDGELPLSFEEMCLLIKTARNAGMEIYPEDREITLVIDYADTSRHYVYASVSDSKRRMLSKLNEIFFCGEPMIIDEQ